MSMLQLSSVLFPQFLSSSSATLSQSSTTTPACMRNRRTTTEAHSAIREETGRFFQLPYPHTIKEGTLVLLDSGLDGKWWADSMECNCYVGKYARPPGRWEDTLWKAVRSTTCWPGYSVWSDGRILLYFW